MASSPASSSPADRFLLAGALSSAAFFAAGFFAFVARFAGAGASSSSSPRAARAFSTDR